MSAFKIGDLFTTQGHPFSSDFNKILIGGDAMFTPPIMVVCEIQNSDGKYDISDGETNVSQVRGMFYSPKTHKFERHFFSVNEIKKIASIEPSEVELTRAGSLRDLKSNLKNKQVILNSVDFELEKNRVNISRKNMEDKMFKTTSFLNFAPPVMTVINVREHEKPKENYYKETGAQKRTHSKYELKCRYYNHHSATFSEEWFPLECVLNVSGHSKLGNPEQYLEKCVWYDFETPRPFENGKIVQHATVLKIKEIVFYHYKYKALAKEVYTGKIFDTDYGRIKALEDYDPKTFFEGKRTRISQSNPVNRGAFTLNRLCEISYLSDRLNSTKRLIYVKELKDFEDDVGEVDTLIIANCLLRNGEIRHFKLSNIKSLRKVAKDQADKIIR